MNKTRNRVRPRAAYSRSGVRWHRGWLSHNRRFVMSLLLCAAAGLTVVQLTPSPAASASVIGAARDLPVGTTLTAADLLAVNVPAELAVAGITEPSEAIGKQLAAPLSTHQILWPGLLLGPGLLAGAPPGSTAVPLRMADPTAVQLLSPGHLVTIIRAGEDATGATTPPEVLARSVPVLWTSESGGGDAWLATADADGLIVVAATPNQNDMLAGASIRGKLFFVVDPPR